jgi:hypothetical protein
MITTRPTANQHVAGELHAVASTDVECARTPTAILVSASRLLTIMLATATRRPER